MRKKIIKLSIILFGICLILCLFICLFGANKIACKLVYVDSNSGKYRIKSYLMFIEYNDEIQSTEFSKLLQNHIHIDTSPRWMISDTYIQFPGKSGEHTSWSQAIYDCEFLSKVLLKVTLADNDLKKYSQEMYNLFKEGKLDQLHIYTNTVADSIFNDIKVGKLEAFGTVPKR